MVIPGSGELTYTDRGLLYGEGVFETLHVRPDGPWLLDAHLARLSRSAAAVESVREVRDCVVLGVEQRDGGYWMPLFVKLADGAELTDELTGRIRAAIRSQASPRHVPDEVLVVPAVPHTRTGKRLEVPLKRLFQGVDPAKALNVGAVDDPAAVEHYVRLARQRGTR